MFLDRVVIENGFIEIINKYVQFEEHIELEQIKYDLVGVTAIET